MLIGQTAIAGAAAGVLTDRLLISAAGVQTGSPAETASSPVMRSFDRRRFVRAGVAAAGIAMAAGGLGRLLSSRATAAASRAAALIPTPADIVPPPPAGADLGVPGVAPFLTPNATFYRVDTALFVPAVDSESWG